MRTIREMLGNDERVWVYIDSRETWGKFIMSAVSEGYRFGELPVEKYVYGNVIAVHVNGNMGHLSMYIWCMSFVHNSDECPRKVDFRKYIEKSSEYSCEKSHFTAMIC